jgi:hypothetical protein
MRLALAPVALLYVNDNPQLLELRKMSLAQCQGDLNCYNFCAR